MKHFFLTLTFGALLSSCMVGQETEKLFTPESLIEYVKEGVNLQEWTLESIYLKFDNEENNLDYSKALLIAKFSNNSNNDLKKKYGFEFKRGDYDYLLVGGINISDVEILGCLSEDNESYLSGDDDYPSSFTIEKLNKRYDNDPKQRLRWNPES